MSEERKNIILVVSAHPEKLSTLMLATLKSNYGKQVLIVNPEEAKKKKTEDPSAHVAAIIIEDTNRVNPIDKDILDLTILKTDLEKLHNKVIDPKLELKKPAAPIDAIMPKNKRKRRY